MKLGEAWNTWREDGIFTKFVSPPWVGENISALNNMYYLRISNKTISATFENTMQVYPDTYKQVIADIATAYYYDKWNKLWGTYHAEYEILSNSYKLTETGSGTKEGTESSTSNIARTGTEKTDRTENSTETRTGTESTENTKNISTARTGTEVTAAEKTITVTTEETVTNAGTATSNANNNVYAFNSAEPVPTDTNNGTSETNATQTTNTTENTTDVLDNTLTLNTKDTTTGTDNTTLTLDTTNTTTETGNSTLTLNTQTAATGSGTNNSQSTYNKQVAGNTGGKYPAEILEKERKLWLTEYFSIVFADLDKILTNPIYERK